MSRIVPLDDAATPLGTRGAVSGLMISAGELSRRIQSSFSGLDSFIQIRYPVRTGRRLSPSNDARTINGKGTACLPATARLRGSNPDRLLFPELVYVPHPFRIQDVPETRYAKAPFSVYLAFRVHYYLDLASATDSLQPFVGRCFVAVRHGDEGDVQVRGCVRSQAKECFLGERTAAMA